MILNDVMAVILRYFTDRFGKCVPTHRPNRVDLWRNLCTSLLYFVVRARCRRKESSRSLYLISWWVSCFLLVVGRLIKFLSASWYVAVVKMAAALGLRVSAVITLFKVIRSFKFSNFDILCDFIVNFIHIAPFARYRAVLIELSLLTAGASL